MTETPSAAASKSRVALVRCPDYGPATVHDALRRSFDLLGGLQHFVRPGATVLLKPNVMMPKPSGSACNTHPAVLRGLIELFKDAGGAVAIGESSAGSLAGLTFTKRALVESGLDVLAAETGVRLINFDLDAVETVATANPLAPSVPIARAVRAAGLTVTVPKLKTHTYANVITGAVKNCFGCVPGQIKAEFHRRAPRPRDFYGIVRDVFAAVRPGLAVFDAVTAMEGNGPSAGRERPLGWIIASADPVAADSVAAALVGVPPLQVLTTRLCDEAGLGRGHLEEIEIAGDRLEDAVVRDFKRPATAVTNPLLQRFVLGLTTTVPVIDQRTCTRCRTCAESCPVKAIGSDTGAMVIDRRACIRCFCCAEVCPEHAITPRRRNRLGDILSKAIASRW